MVLTRVKLVDWREPIPEAASATSESGFRS